MEVRICTKNFCDNGINKKSIRDKISTKGIPKVEHANCTFYCSPSRSEITGIMITNALNGAHQRFAKAKGKSVDQVLDYLIDELTEKNFFVTV